MPAESEGTAVAVSDEEILDAGRQLASLEGIFAAPEGAACVTAARQLIADRFLKPGDRIVLYNTGSGLKYLDAYATPGRSGVHAGRVQWLRGHSAPRLHPPRRRLAPAS